MSVRPKSIRKYLKLARITVWPAALFSFAVGFGTGATQETVWADSLFALLAVLSFFIFAFALNFYSDTDTDRYHSDIQKDVKLSKQPLLTGEVSRRECILLCIIFFVSAIALGWLAGSLVGLLMLLACLIGGILYSHPLIRLKGKPLADILCMSSLSVILFSAGYVASKGMMPGWPILVFFGLFAAIVYIPTVINDYKYDLRAGLKTSAVVFGQRNMVRAMWLVCLLALPVVVLIILGPYPPGIKVLTVIAYLASTGDTAVATRCLKPPHFILPVVSRYPRGVTLVFGVIPLLFILWGWFQILSGDVVDNPFRMA